MMGQDILTRLTRSDAALTRHRRGMTKPIQNQVKMISKDPVQYYVCCK
jgi:hypothetical protein